MTGWEVLSDLIKIGVPSLLTGTAAFFIAKSTRLHDFEKERRRRKQDCLERAIEDFDECQSALDNLWSVSQTVPLFKHEAAQFVAVLNDANEAGDSLDAAQVKFGRNRSKLSVFGFDECAEALKSYDFAIARMKVTLLPVREGKEGAKEASHESLDRLFVCGHAFRDAVATALKQL
jgi:hypothetical protein